MISSPVQNVRGHYDCSVTYGPSRSRQSHQFASAAPSKSGGTMAKKAGTKTAIVQGVQPPTSSFDEMYPTIARWISQEEGWIELGADHYSRSLARALYGGGMVWEGTDEYGSLDEALRAMEEGIASWPEEDRPDRLTGVRVGRARGGSCRDAGTTAV